MRLFFKITRWVLTIVGTVVLSTLAINAADNIGNLQNSLLGSVISFGGSAGPCPSDMAYVTSDAGGFCVDLYEESAGSDCPNGDPKNQEETRANLDTPSCKPASVPNAVPWRNISEPQAARACAAAGKRLPSDKEWYEASLGTPDAPGNVTRGDCNVNNDNNGSPSKTGSHAECVSSFGVYDMVGNVWEWIDASVVNGSIDGQTLPESGYVTSIDANGIPIQTSSDTPDLNFNQDYAWINHTDTRGVIRGGYYGNGTDAGNYAFNAITPPSFAGTGVGFRCVK